MSPFTARAEVFNDEPSMDKVLGLRLDPIAATVRVPRPLLLDRTNALRAHIELSRRLLHDTRKVATLALYKAVAGAEAPPDFDWEQMDRDELADTLRKNQELERRVERKDVIIRNYRAFMEANGKGWRAIEKLGA